MEDPVHAHILSLLTLLDGGGEEGKAGDGWMAIAKAGVLNVPLLQSVEVLPLKTLKEHAHVYGLRVAQELESNSVRGPALASHPPLIGLLQTKLRIKEGLELRQGLLGVNESQCNIADELNHIAKAYNALMKTKASVQALTPSKSSLLVGLRRQQDIVEKSLLAESSLLSSTTPAVVMYSGVQLHLLIITLPYLQAARQAVEDPAFEYDPKLHDLQKKIFAFPMDRATPKMINVIATRKQVSLLFKLHNQTLRELDALRRAFVLVHHTLGLEVPLLTPSSLPYPPDEPVLSPKPSFRSTPAFRADSFRLDGFAPTSVWGSSPPSSQPPPASTSPLPSTTLRSPPIATITGSSGGLRSARRSGSKSQLIKEAFPVTVSPPSYVPTPAPAPSDTAMTFDVAATTRDAEDAAYAERQPALDRAPHLDVYFDTNGTPATGASRTATSGDNMGESKPSEGATGLGRQVIQSPLSHALSPALPSPLLSASRKTHTRVGGISVVFYEPDIPASVKTYDASAERRYTSPSPTLAGSHGIKPATFPIDPAGKKPDPVRPRSALGARSTYFQETSQKRASKSYMGHAMEGLGSAYRAARWLGSSKDDIMVVPGRGEKLLAALYEGVPFEPTTSSLFEQPNEGALPYPFDSESVTHTTGTTAVAAAAVPSAAMVQYDTADAEDDNVEPAGAQVATLEQIGSPSPAGSPRMATTHAEIAAKIRQGAPTSATKLPHSIAPKSPYPSIRKASMQSQVPAYRVDMPASPQSLDHIVSKRAASGRKPWSAAAERSDSVSTPHTEFDSRPGSPRQTNSTHTSRPGTPHTHTGRLSSVERTRSESTTFEKLLTQHTLRDVAEMETGRKVQPDASDNEGGYQLDAKAAELLGRIDLKIQRGDENGHNGDGDHNGVWFSGKDLAALEQFK